MPIPIQQGRTLAALVERFGIKGRHLLQLDEIVVPVAIVDDVRASDIRSTVFRARQGTTAVVGENAVLEFNSGNGADCLPRFVRIDATAAGEVWVLRELSTPAVSPVFSNASSTGGFDAWNPPAPGPCQVRAGTFPIAGLGGTLIAQLVTPAGDNWVEIHELLHGSRVTPGRQLYLINQTANTAPRFSWQYAVEPR